MPQRLSMITTATICHRRKELATLFPARFHGLSTRSNDFRTASAFHFLHIVHWAAILGRRSTTAVASWLKSDAILDAHALSYISANSMKDDDTRRADTLSSSHIAARRSGPTRGSFSAAARYRLLEYVSFSRSRRSNNAAWVIARGFDAGDAMRLLSGPLRLRSARIAARSINILPSYHAW
jgi:hypothetical protein